MPGGWLQHCSTPCRVTDHELSRAAAGAYIWTAVAAARPLASDCVGSKHMSAACTPWRRVSSVLWQALPDALVVMPPALQMLEQQLVWQRLRQVCEEGATADAVVESTRPAGLIVKVANCVSGFVPGSHVQEVCMRWPAAPILQHPPRDHGAARRAALEVGFGCQSCVKALQCWTDGSHAASHQSSHKAAGGASLQGSGTRAGMQGWEGFLRGLRSHGVQASLACMLCGQYLHWEVVWRAE